MSNTIIPSLRQIFRRDLLKLRQEIASYSDEEKIWHIEKKISNSAGNLCLHLVGNLNTYIGAQIGKTGYIRNREQEFSKKGLSIVELTASIDETLLVVENTLARMHDEELAIEYPVKVFADTMTTGFFLIHLAAHLNYHLGQINYHRRLIDSKKPNLIPNVHTRAFC
jgi:uncharacterized damage-inducible protein DinB